MVFSYAYGRRMIPKLAETISDESLSPTSLEKTLTALCNALLIPEEKCAAVNAQPSMFVSLARLLRAEEEPLRCLACECLGSLGSILQGRIAMASHGTVQALTQRLVVDSSNAVKAAAANALVCVSMSRDGACGER